MAEDAFIIGTRDSKLAVWQAEWVSVGLKSLGCRTRLRFIKTEGDLVLDTPLPLMGGKGVFTKALDDALLCGEIDLAVHSYKDIPTRIPEGLSVSAVSIREDHRDALVLREGSGFAGDSSSRAVIATSSLRRAGQWLHRYPEHTITDIRGNVLTRLKKLSQSDWDGAIFAAAGLKRLKLVHMAAGFLDWMLPAPAQGAMAVMTRTDDSRLLKYLSHLHHPETALCTKIERDFLNELEGGCSAPICALARIEKSEVILEAAVLQPNGRKRIDIRLREKAGKASDLGRKAARQALSKGARDIIHARS